MLIPRKVLSAQWVINKQNWKGITCDEERGEMPRIELHTRGRPARLTLPMPIIVTGQKTGSEGLILPGLLAYPLG